MLARQLTSCADSSGACVGWAAYGYCTSNPGMMQQNCPETCGWCTPPSSPTTTSQLSPPPPSGCVDLSGACAGWAAYGYCTSNPGMMQQNCPETCGWCTPPSAPRFGSGLDASVIGLAQVCGRRLWLDCVPNLGYRRSNSTHQHCAASHRAPRYVTPPLLPKGASRKGKRPPRNGARLRGHCLHQAAQLRHCLTTNVQKQSGWDASCSVGWGEVGWGGIG